MGRGPRPPGGRLHRRPAPIYTQENFERGGQAWQP
nr:MAG TPA: hypothetical protein [Caudoviricetes sp.]